MRKAAFALLGALCALGIFFCTLASAQEQQQQQTPPEQPQLHEEVTVRWWIVPVYAVDKAGAPVLNLNPDDLEVYIKGIKVEQFSLHKKEFKVTETRKGEVATPAAPSPEQQAPPQKKMVFLVFDAASTPLAILAKGKTICEDVIEQSGPAATYVLLTIEPYAGLHYICGPTGDLKFLRQEMRHFILGKNTSLRPGRDDVRNIYPSSSLGFSHRGLVGDFFGEGREGLINRYQKTLAFRSALLTLSIVLGHYREYSKVVYLYSAGVPIVTGIGGGGAESSAESSAELLSMLGKSLNKSGALLLLINPAGTRELSFFDESGKGALQVLASVSGGRYFEGEQKQIVEQVNDMEGGYYEVSFPDKPEYTGQELSFEIRSKKPGVTIYTLRNVGREKSYADMNELERQFLVLNILNDGPNALTAQKVIYVKKTESRDGETLVCRLTLPEELARNEFTLFKIAQDFQTGDIRVDMEQVVSQSPDLEVRMKWRGKFYRHDVVLAHLKTGTILVAK